MIGLPSRSLPLLALMVLVACGPKVLHVDDRPRSTRAPDQVQLFIDAPDRPYRTIGLIRSEGVSLFNDVEARKRQVRAAAARLGADAVILGFQSHTASGSVVTTDSDGDISFGVMSSDKVHIFGRAIVFSVAGEDADGGD